MSTFYPRVGKYFFIIIAIVFIGVLTRQFAQGSGKLAATDQALSLLDGSFEYVEIDSTIGGDIKLVGDIDGDSFPDLVMGGFQSERLNWYRYPTWEKTVIHTPDVEFTTGGAMGDVDGDGDLDIVVPDGSSGNNLRWFENPRPSGNPSAGSQWIEHTIGSIGSWGKDVFVADYDGNGRLDVATREQVVAMIFFQTGDDIWSKMSFSGVNLGNEGMSSGRVDGDNHEDLVLRGVWLRNPGGSAARTASNWNQFTIGTANSDFKALVADVDKDDITDILFASSENTDEVVWYEPTSGNPTGSWTKHIIAAALERVHTLQVADMDLDGDNDVVLAQMHTSTAKEIMVMENLDGQAGSWQKHVIDNTGLHNGVVADIGSDGDFDIYGANWAGNPPVKLYLNQGDDGDPNPTVTASPTNPPAPTNTPLPTATPTILATATSLPLPTATSTNQPPPTSTPEKTRVPPATITNTPIPSATATDTAVPTAANTPVPTINTTRIPPTTATYTAVPTATNTPEPTTITRVPPATATVGCTPTPGTVRVTDGLQLLYLFNEGGGNTISDVAGAGTPINLTIGNSSAVSWLQDGGLVVNSPTTIQSGSPPTRLTDALLDSNEITLEAWVIPDNLQLTGPARILTLSADPYFRNFTLGQEFDAYEMRLRTTTTNNNGFPRIFGPAGSATTNLTHIVFTRQANGDAVLYVDNAVEATAYQAGTFANWNEAYELALANELSQDRPWLGTYHLISVYDRALSAAEIIQNYNVGPRPEANGCESPVGGLAGSQNESTSPASWLVGVIEDLVDLLTASL